MLSPASIRMRVFSVARRAVLPVLPLARTQNLRMPCLREIRIQRIAAKQNGLSMFWFLDNQPSGERRDLLVGGPGRPHGFSQGRNLVSKLSRTGAEDRLGARIEVVLP